MLRALLLRLWSNLGTFLLSFAIAFAVWISAVVAADPSEERDYPNPLTLEIRGLDPGLVMLGTIPSQVQLRLSAPVSLWERLTGRPDSVHVFIDLTDLGTGEHTVPLEVDSQFRPFRVVQVIPSDVTINLEPLAIEEFPITTQLDGVPALGFEVSDVAVDPAVATVSGPATLVAQVEHVIARLNVGDAREMVSSQVALQTVDENGNVLSGLTVEPVAAEVEQDIVQAGGYRDVAVNVETVGQPAGGFRVTSISVDPPIVTLFSTDTNLISALPGYVSTLPLDLSASEENITARLALNLPQGVIVVGDEQNVEVQIGIAPIETSTLLNVEVEVTGLAAGFEAELSPQTVAVIVSGPLSTLQSLRGDDIRLFVDLSGLQPGAHLLEPQAEILPRDVQLFSIVPSSIEVIIRESTTP